MRKYLIAVLVGSMLIIGMASPATAHQRPGNACRFQNRQPGYWTRDEVRWTVKCLANWMNVDVDHATYIAYRESRYFYKAVSWTGCCVGVYQHQSKYWSGRVQDHLRKLRKFHVHDRSWTSPRAQAVVTFAMVKQGGWGPWGG